MYATMIACAFASCSKDDEVIDNGGATAGTSLDVKIAVPQTKSLGGESGASDAAITDIVVYVFENDKIQVISDGAVGSSTTDASRKISNLTAGTKKVLVLANCTDKLSPKPAVGTTLSQLEAATSSINNEVNGKLSMNSQVYEVTLTSNVTNYLGYASVPTTGSANLNTQVSSMGENPVYLYRNVAKITLNSVTLSNENASRYPNATLAITKVFILHGATKANIAGDGTAWNNNANTTSWTNGIDKTAYDAFVTTAEKYVASSKLIKKYTASGIAADAWSNYVLAPVAPKTSLYTLDYTNKKNTGTTSVDQFYAFENHSIDTQTLLVVEGTFTYGPAGKTVSTTRYYTVGIGIDNLQNQGNYKDGTYTLNTLTRTDVGVLRNIQYMVDLTVSGPGYETPFGPKSDENTNLDAQVQVVPFGTVNQSTNIE